MRGYCSKCGQFVEIRVGDRHSEQRTSRRWYPLPHVDADGAPCVEGPATEAGEIEFGVAPREGAN